MSSKERKTYYKSAYLKLSPPVWVVVVVVVVIKHCDYNHLGKSLSGVMVPEDRMSTVVEKACRKLKDCISTTHQKQREQEVEQGYHSSKSPPLVMYFLQQLPYLLKFPLSLQAMLPTGTFKDMSQWETFLIQTTSCFFTFLSKGLFLKSLLYHYFCQYLCPT